MQGKMVVGKSRQLYLNNNKHMIKSKWKMFIVVLDTSYVLLLDTRNPGVSNVLFPVVP